MQVQARPRLSIEGDPVCRGVLAEQSEPDPAVVDVLHEFWPMFVNSRSLSVYLPESLLDSERFAPGPFYCATTPYSYVQLKTPLSPEIRTAHNRIGAWTNENFLIRLWAILESHGFTKPIRANARGSDAVRLLKRLRQHFAHGTGLYGKRKRDHRKLRCDLLKLFSVPGEHDDIPTNIDYVMRPMFVGCLKYVDDVLKDRPVLAS